MIVDHLFAHERRAPGKAAIIRGDLTLSYAELAKRVRTSAGVLASLGVGHGDRVVLAAQSEPEFVSSYLAVHLVGGIAVPVSPHGRSSALARICDLASPVLLVGCRTEGWVSVNYDQVLAGVAAAAEQDHWERPGQEDSADLLFTTGTTADPKGVLLSHRAIETAAEYISAFLGQRGDDVEVLPLPLYHSFGLGRLRCCIYQGSSLVLVDGPTLFADAMRALRRFRGTGFSSVPSGFAVIFETLGDALGEFAGQLRYIEIGSSPMNHDHKLRLMALLPTTRICMHYGLTEASRSAFIEFHESRSRLDSVGRPSPGVEIAAVDHSGSIQPTGTEGQIAIRSNAVMTGYWNAEEATRRAYLDGWLLTGDRGHLDDEGYLYLTGRESDLINIGGRKVAPGEIENILREHPAIADCACIGIPDPAGISGSVIKAFLVARAPDDPQPANMVLAKHLRGRIEPYKMPRVFEWIDAIPRSESGKLLRKDLN